MAEQEITLREAGARIAALEIFVTRFVILQLKTLEKDYGSDQVNDAIDRLDKQIADTLAKVSAGEGAASEFARDVDERVSWLMGLLRSQFRSDDEAED